MSQFRLEFLIFFFSILLFFIKLIRLKIPLSSIIEFDYKYHGYLWECYEIVSGSYILINLIFYLDSGSWIINPDFHWFVLIAPILFRKILVSLKDCGLLGKDPYVRSHTPE